MTRNLQENIAREALHPIDEAKRIQELLDLMEGDKDKLAPAIGVSKTLITQRIALLHMSDALIEALREDEITIAQARVISQLPDEMHQQFINRASMMLVNQLKDQVKREMDRMNPQEEVSTHAGRPDPIPSGGGGGSESPEYIERTSEKDEKAETKEEPRVEDPRAIRIQVIKDKLISINQGLQVEIDEEEIQAMLLESLLNQDLEVLEALLLAAENRLQELDPDAFELNEATKPTEERAEEETAESEEKEESPQQSMFD